MDFETWLLFAVTDAILCFVPGPAVLLVVSIGLTSGWRPGLAAVLGILAVNAGYFALSATGIAAVLVASSQAFAVMKWSGAAYLVWTGARMLLAPPEAAGTTSRTGGAGPLSRFFRHGLLTQGANPKALLFFTAIVPQFVDTERPIVPQMAILGATSIAIEIAALSIYFAICDRARTSVGPAVHRGLQRAGGGLLIAAGAQLATLRRAS